MNFLCSFTIISLHETQQALSRTTADNRARNFRLTYSVLFRMYVDRSLQEIRERMLYSQIWPVRSARATSIFPVCVSSLLRRRYISSRRKKFNVAVKADGNADCGLRASPVTALHRMVHISRVHRPFAPSSAAHWPSASLSIPWIPSRLIPRRLREALGGLWILTRGSQNTSADIAYNHRTRALRDSVIEILAEILAPCRFEAYEGKN